MRQMEFFSPQILFFCELKPHAKFPNPKTTPGAEKYRECGNNVPRKTGLWQEGRSIFQEEPGR
jgi:hypothetical protein